MCEPEAVILLIFFIKFRFVALAFNKGVLYPRGRLSHDSSAAVAIDIFRSFDNKLIMDMIAYLLVG